MLHRHIHDQRKINAYCNYKDRLYKYQGHLELVYRDCNIKIFEFFFCYQDVLEWLIEKYPLITLFEVEVLLLL